MSATDELRRLLDERGVEWTYRDGTMSYASDGRWFHAWAHNDDAMCVSMGYLTPAQAVEATLGSDLKAENEKLRELVRIMPTCLEHYEPGDTISCEQCPYDNETWGCDYERLMAELGVDV